MCELSDENYILTETRIYEFKTAQALEGVL